jgi:ketosteroid isomerase-like protein
MRSGACTPEELETLYEDAFVLRDRDAVAQLFDTGAVLVAGDESTEARGAEAIARLAAAMWDRDQTYLAAPRRVLQAHDTTLVVADGAINVLRRRSDGRWRYAISLLNNDDTTERQNR